MKLENLTYITNTMQNNIKFEEVRLDAVCTRVIMQENRLGEKIIYGIFGKDKDIITLGSLSKEGNILNSLAYNS